MKLLNTCALAFAVSQLAACGSAQKKEVNPLVETAATASGSEEALFLDDSLDEVSSSVAALDDDAIPAAGLNLVGLASARGKVSSRSCVEEGDTAVVSINKEAGRARLVGGLASKKGAVSGIKLEESLKRTFSLEGGAVKCKDEKSAAPDFTAPKGLKIDVEFSRKFAAAGALRAQAARAGKASGEATGERHIAFLDSVVVTDEKIENSLQISSRATRTFDGNRANGEETLKSQTVATAEDAPLMVRVVRLKADQSLVERIIESGKVVTDRGNGSKLEISYDHVAFVREDKCVRPQSGAINGQLTKADGTILSFKVEFSADSAKMTKADGSVEEFGNACEVAEAAAAEVGQ